MLPLLAALFLISYALLTTLVVLQDRTIDSQRSLIHSLFSDNLHLVATKLGSHRSQATGSNQNPSQAGATKQPPVSHLPSTQTPSNQLSAMQNPSTQVPVIQAKPETGAKPSRNTRKAQKVPVRPPAEMTDPSDMRRVSISI